MILLDTNLLTRMTRSLDPQCGVARNAIQTLRTRRERLIVVPQNLYEFWAVATRPVGAPPAGGNGLGMSPGQAGQWLRFFLRRFTFLPGHNQLRKRPEISVTSSQLVSSYSVHATREHGGCDTSAIRRSGFDVGRAAKAIVGGGRSHDLGLRRCLARLQKHGHFAEGDPRRLA